ncbi:MAG: sugar nucleotide-binding protein [Fibrobacterota bacterium]
MSINILVIGSGGLLGGTLLRRAPFYPDVSLHPVFYSGIPEPFAASGHQADIRDTDSLHRLFGLVRPDCVVNLTCLPVGDCERDLERAQAVQVEGARVLARACGGSIRLIHFSTDMVYSGNKGAPYTLEDVPDPISVYGRTKLEGEAAVREHASDAVIIRSALILGLPAYKPGGFLEWMVTRAKNGRSLPLFTDQWRTPIAADDLADAVIRLAASPVQGVLLAGGDRGVNRVTLGEWTVDALKLPRTLLQPLVMAEAKSEVPLQADLRFDNSAFKAAAGIRLTDIETYIRRTLA